MTSTPLHVAVESGDVERVRDLLANTDDVRAALHARDDDGCTLLMLGSAAALPITLALLQVLVERGARLNDITSKGIGAAHAARDRWSHTPWHVAPVVNTASASPIRNASMHRIGWR